MSRLNRSLAISVNAINTLASLIPAVVETNPFASQNGGFMSLYDLSVAENNSLLVNTARLTKILDNISTISILYVAGTKRSKLEKRVNDKLIGIGREGLFTKPELSRIPKKYVIELDNVLTELVAIRDFIRSDIDGTTSTAIALLSSLQFDLELDKNMKKKWTIVM